MTRRPFPTLAALALLLVPAAARAQAVGQAGPWTAGHAPMYLGSGFGQPLVQDSGSAAGGGPGSGLSELDLTVRGTGTAPYANAGTGPLGTNNCDYDAPTTNAGGYHFLCVSPNALGGGLLAYGAGGGATPLPLSISVNGTLYAFPFSIGGIVGPGTTVVGDIPLWNNITGTLLSDSGVKLPASALVGISDTQTLTNKSIAAGEVNSGTLAAAQMPGLTGDVTSSAGSVATTIAANAVTNAKAAQASGNTVKGNPTGSTANVQDMAMPSCSGSSNALIWTSGTGFGCGTLGTAPAPQGRLTLVTGTPVMTADEANKSTVYYDDYVGSFVPVYNGSGFVTQAITNGEISMGLDAVTPHIAFGNLYDIFGFISSGNLAICAGPAWSTTTSRGSGAGSTQITMVQGIWTNAVALTHCWGGASGTTDYGTIAQNQGTYLGTLYATANGQTTVNLKPAAAAGGTDNVIGIWNAYNRITEPSLCRDSTSSWTYSTNTWRAADGNSANRVTWVDGLAQSPTRARYTITLGPSASSAAAGGIGVMLNGTNSFTGFGSQEDFASIASQTSITAMDETPPNLGLNFYQAVEISSNGGTTFYGAGASVVAQTQGLLVELAW